MYKKPISFIVIILALFSNWVLADELGVTITKIKGSCEVMKAGEVEWIKATVNMRLYPNDRIHTKLISNATLEFDDGTIIEMKENTTIDIKELFENKWTGRTKSEMNLWIGEILGTIEKLKTRASEFNLHTPVAVIGVRGTKIRVNVGSKGETTCYVDKGEVRMRGINQHEDRWTTITELEYSKCISGDEVSLPEKFEPLPQEAEIQPPQSVFPSPQINVQFQEQNKPFINRVPNVTVLVSLPPDIKEIPISFLQIGDDKVIELPKGLTKYSFRPFLKPGPNELLIKAWYEKGQPASISVRFPFFDPHPPIIRIKRYLSSPSKELVDRIKKDNFTTTKEFPGKVLVDIFVTVADLGSGVKDVTVNGKRMQKIKEGYYKGVVFLEVKTTVAKTVVQQETDYEVTGVKLLEKVKLKVTDNADNEIIEILNIREDEIRIKLERRLNVQPTKIE